VDLLTIAIGSAHDSGHNAGSRQTLVTAGFHLDGISQYGGIHKNIIIHPRVRQTSDGLTQVDYISTKYLRVCLFCLGPRLSPRKRRVVRRRNFARRRVRTMCRTCAGFYIRRGRPYENKNIFVQSACV